MSLNKFFCLLLAVGVLPLTSLADNPSGNGTKDKPQPCPTCPEEGETMASMDYVLYFGAIPFESKFSAGHLMVVQTKPAPTIFTPESLSYRSVLTALIAKTTTNTGSWTISVTLPDSTLVDFLVPQDKPEGVITGKFQARKESIQLVGADGQPVVAGLGNPLPHHIIITEVDGGRIELNWATRKAVAYTSITGRRIVFADLPQEIAVKILTEDGVLRQIKAPQGLADLVQITPQAYEIRIYEPAHVGAYDGTSKTYGVTGTPYRVVRFENATENLADYGHVKITENWGTRTKISYFDYNPSTEEWSLREGGSGLSRGTTKAMTPGPGANDRTYTRRLLDQDGRVISTSKEVWRDFPWREELVSKTAEPDTLRMEETYSYYTVSGPGYSQVKTKTYPDGYWEMYSYDANKRVTQLLTPWKDAPFNLLDGDGSSPQTRVNAVIVALNQQIATEPMYLPVDEGSVSGGPVLAPINPRWQQLTSQLTVLQSLRGVYAAGTDAQIDSAYASYAGLTVYSKQDAFGDALIYKALNASRTMPRITVGPRVITSYSYDSLDVNDVVASWDNRPRTITESIVTAAGGIPIVTKQTYHVYRTDAEGVYSEITERAGTNTAIYGQAGNLRTTRVYYTNSATHPTYDAISAGRLQYEDSEDGTRMIYTYTRNTANLTAYFTISEVLTTPSLPSGLDGLSTRVDRIHNSRGDLVKTEHYIRATNTWILVQTDENLVNGQGFRVYSSVNGRQIYAATYDADLLVSRTVEDGVTTTMTYDALDKKESETRVGVPATSTYAAQADITTLYVRELGGLDCGCDGSLTAITSAGSLSLEAVIKKDPIGHQTYQKDAAGMETNYTYDLGGRQSTRTNADGSTVIGVRYIDRRPQSVSGTGVIPAYSDYGVNTTGTTWTKVTQVFPAGVRWEKITTNQLDQIVQVERPSYDGGTLVTSYGYDEQGRRIRERQRHISGSMETALVADTLMGYDALGNVNRRGLDVNANGVLDLVSSDRITDVLTSFVEHDSAWWQVRQRKVYPTASSATAVQVSESRERLSGLTGTLAAETLAIDIDGNVTRQTRQIDVAGKLVTTTTTYPDSMLAAVSVTRNGLLMSESDKTVAKPRDYGYDALGRVTSTKEPRHTHAATITYDAVTGQTASRTDAAGYTTLYEYYTSGSLGAGRIKCITDALSHTRRFGYDALGHIIFQWGSASYPQSYTYTATGELSTLTTWRDIGAANLDASTWPSLSGGDTTTWTYQASTGMLTRKQYADIQGTNYTYDKLNRLSARMWARSVSGIPLTTTYAYEPMTGELTSVDYNDTTPDIAITRDRLGRQASVTDATGTRTFTYDPISLRFTTETLPAPFYGNRILTHAYQAAASASEPTSVRGRLSGFAIGTVGGLESDYAISYNYERTGRLSTVTGPGGTYIYGYSSNSNLRGIVTGPAHTATYTYDLDRDVLDTVENKVGDTIVSEFHYIVDGIGQRTQRTSTGSAFGTVSSDVFTYNAKGEVIGSLNSRLSTLDQSYTYDQIGNRVGSQLAGASAIYTANSLNQYTQLSNLSSGPSYDADGNQTVTGSGRRYTWDAENRLIMVEPLIPSFGDQKQVNVYDAQSRRVRRQVSTYSSGSWVLTTDEKFIYNGWNLAAVLDSTDNSTLIRTYMWGMDFSGSLQNAGGVGGLLSVRDRGQVYHYTYDGNGNVSEVLGRTGDISGHYEYDVFGNTVALSAAYAATNMFRFSTKLLDGEGGLYYYGFRYYDPSCGRWLGRDPIGESGGVNLFAFLENGPLSSVDFLGMFESLNILSDFDGAISACSERFPFVSDKLKAISKQWQDKNESTRRKAIALLDAVNSAADKVGGGTGAASNTAKAAAIIEILTKGKEGKVNEIKDKIVLADEVVENITKFTEVSSKTLSARDAFDALVAISSAVENYGGPAGRFGEYFSKALGTIDALLTDTGAKSASPTLAGLGAFCASCESKHYRDNSDEFEKALSALKNQLNIK